MPIVKKRFRHRSIILRGGRFVAVQAPDFQLVCRLLKNLLRIPCLPPPNLIYELKRFNLKRYNIQSLRTNAVFLEVAPPLERSESLHGRGLVAHGIHWVATPVRNGFVWQGARSPEQF
jgi:hypothetical protein